MGCAIRWSYFERLREAAPKAWIIGEKILAAGEFLRESWPIEGTSGYDFMNVALGLLVRPQGMAELTHGCMRSFTGQPTSFPPIAHDKKIAVAQEALGSDVNRLTTLFCDICENHRDQRDYTRAEIRRAIRETGGVLRDLPDVCLCRSETQMGSGPNEVTAEDVRFISKGDQVREGKTRRY